jgi:hypothetical protein
LLRALPGQVKIDREDMSAESNCQIFKETGSTMKMAQWFVAANSRFI